MALRLYNTLSRQVEEFVPLQPGRVSLYTCGPTVYNYAHIGNFRTFLFEDLLHRWLEASGYDVFRIMNITDVDDKTIKGASEAGKSLKEFVQYYVDAFQEDRRWMRMRDASEYPRATEFIGSMISLVEDLLAKGVAYRAEDGSVYFSISRFPAYGRLSRVDTRELKTGASQRIASDEYTKEDARDFALWKFAKPEDEAVGAAWDAPFGRGRPGWHLECSAMALELIGDKWGTEVLDIHAGGVDLIFPHHEDEIAQSCTYTGKDKFAHYWVHGEFLNVRGAKMSKRFGNITTPRDLREDGVDAGAIRLLMFQTHYRQKFDLTDEGLDAAQQASKRLFELRYRLGEFVDKDGKPLEPSEAPEFMSLVHTFRASFTEALNDDLNAPAALASYFEFVRRAHALMDDGLRPGQQLINTWWWAEWILQVTADAETYFAGLMVGLEALNEGVRLAPRDASDVESWARDLAERRKTHKSKGEYAQADDMRRILLKHGYDVRDRRDGSYDLIGPKPDGVAK